MSNFFKREKRKAKAWLRSVSVSSHGIEYAAI